MSNEQKLHEDLSAGQRAADALETLGASLDALERQYFEGFKTSDFRDTHGRENLFKSAQIVGFVRKHLISQVSNGKLAERELNEIRKFGKRRFGIV
jgi:hypothetical protein